MGLIAGPFKTELQDLPKVGVIFYNHDFFHNGKVTFL